MNTKIGINSPQIKDFGGAIDPCEVEIIELGKINFMEVFKNILKTNTRNLILEVKNSTRQCTLESLGQIREFCSLRSGLMPSAMRYSIETTVACVQ